MPAVLAFFSNPKYPTEFCMPRRGCCSTGKQMAQIQSGARTPCVFLKHHRGLSSALSDIFPVLLKLCFSCAYLVMIRKKLASLRMTSLFLKCFILCVLMFACIYIYVQPPVCLVSGGQISWSWVQDGSVLWTNPRCSGRSTCVSNPWAISPVLKIASLATIFNLNNKTVLLNAEMVYFSSLAFVEVLPSSSLPFLVDSTMLLV